MPRTTKHPCKIHLSLSKKDYEELKKQSREEEPISVTARRLLRVALAEHAEP